MNTETIISQEKRAIDMAKEIKQTAPTDDRAVGKCVGSLYKVDVANIKSAILNNFIMSKAKYLKIAPKFYRDGFSTNAREVERSNASFFRVGEFKARPVNRNDLLEVCDDIMQNFRSDLEHEEQQL